MKGWQLITKNGDEDIAADDGGDDDLDEGNAGAKGWQLITKNSTSTLFSFSAAASLMEKRKKRRQSSKSDFFLGI